MKKCVFIALAFVLLGGIMASCAPHNAAVSAAPPSPSVMPEPSGSGDSPGLPAPSNQLDQSALPQTQAEKYVIVQDYADNETSAAALKPFAKALNTELSLQEGADDRLALSGPEQFVLNAAVPFEQGALICGHTLSDGEVYTELFYFDNGSITYRTQNSDCWSLNFTLFKNHTIAYGTSIGWDNGVVMLDYVTAEFADGQTVSQSFPNIPFVSEKKGWADGIETTDGYILVADGQTWVKGIGFYSHDGALYDDWRSDLFSFSVLGSSKPYVWAGQPNEIWTVYSYAPMRSNDSIETVNEIIGTNPLTVRANGEEAVLHSFMLSEQLGVEAVWRNNNSYRWAVEVSRASDIEIHGLEDNDEVFWVSLDADDGSSPPDYASLISSTPPDKAGKYSLLIHNNGIVLKHQAVYFSLFVRLSEDDS